MKIELPLDEMTVEEKIELIEVLWQDIGKRSDDFPVPDWHVEELEKTSRRLEAGLVKTYPLEEAKRRLREMTSR
jgi:hypothetical protein